MISTRTLNELAEIDTIKSLTQSLAVLDAIMCPEWEDRYYSFNSKWSDNEMLASMRNGSGDEWYLLFNRQGAILKGLDHESAMFRFESPIPEIYADVPEVFAGFLDEPAFDIANVSFCIWRKYSDTKWQKGNLDYPPGPDPDGSGHLLSILDGNHLTYQKFADEYYEIELNASHVKSIYDHEPLSDEIITGLNPEINLNELASDLDEIGYRHH